MKKVSLLLLLIVLVGCQKMDDTKGFDVLGDISSPFNYHEFYKAYEDDFESVNYNDTHIQAIDAAIFYQALDKTYESNILYFVSEDGFMNTIEDDSLEDTYIGYCENLGWVYHSDKHPPNSGIKHIKEVILVNDTRTVNYDYGLNIVDGITGENTHYTLGQLYLMPYRIYPYVDGVSKKITEGQTYQVTGMKQKKVLSLSDLTTRDSSLSLIMTGQGDHVYIMEEGYIEIGQTINYIIPESYDVYKDLKGIMINPPQTSIMDLYEDIRMHLDQKVMVVFIDGFSNQQYDYMYEAMDTYLNSFAYEKATSVFQPVTNAGFAAMITGQTPKENGVLDRSYRSLKVDDIFLYANQQGLRSSLIEGSIRILDTSVTPILNLDSDGDDLIDDDIFQSALANLDSDLLFIHFHSLDDFGHTYGPLHEKTLDQLKLIDDYVEELSDKWEGYMLVVTDHGMHKTVEGGNHGSFRSEDLLIPYLRRKHE